MTYYCEVCGKKELCQLIVDDEARAPERCPYDADDAEWSTEIKAVDDYDDFTDETLSPAQRNRKP